MIMHAFLNFRAWALAALMCVSAFCQEPAIMKTVRRLYNGQTPLEARFDLHILWKVREKEESKTGKIVLAPGDKFRVELGASTWVCNGRTYWEASRDANAVQVVIKEPSEIDRSMLPSQMVQSYVKNHGYTLKETLGPLTVVACTADSSSKTPEVERVELSIDSKTGVIKTLLVVDKNGNESVYRFKKTEFPANISESAFDYAIPKGASILDMRNQ
jgi:outer membrane lipoprotein-sorting protein